MNGLKVYTGSWHYRLYNYLRNYFDHGPYLPFRHRKAQYKPKSLCSYFWSTLFMVLGFIPANLNMLRSKPRTP